MKSFWMLIPRSIFKNEKRVFFIAVGIILSITLIISLSIVLDSVEKSAYRSMVDDAGGNFDLDFHTSDKKAIDKIEKDDLIEKVTVSAYLGMYKVPGTNYYLDINGYDKNVSDLVNFKLVEGRYPESNNEIALEQWVIKYLPEKCKVGDKIKLSAVQEYKNMQGKTEEIIVENEFVLTGIFDYTFIGTGDKNKAAAYVTREYVESALPAQFAKYGGYIALNSKQPLEKGAELLMSTDGYDKVFFRINFFKTTIGKVLKTIRFISIILYIIIGIVASIIIYNIFNVSVTERIKEFGMMRAIGSSPGGIKALVLGEGLLLGCVFIPIGIFAGSFSARAIISKISGYRDIGSFLNIPVGGIKACFIIGFFTIIMGVYSPARKASKISPMEAISSNNNLKLEGSKIKHDLKRDSRLSRLFGFSGNMAYLNLNRNRKRYVTTIVSLSISIIIFILVSYLINSIDPIKNLRNNMGGDFVITSTLSQKDYSISEKDSEAIKLISGVGKVDMQKVLQTNMEVEGSKVTSEGFKFLKSQSNLTPETRSNFEQKIYSFHVEAYGYQNEDLIKLKEFIKEGKVDVNEMDGKPIIILGQNLNYSNNTDLKVGDQVKIKYHRYDENGQYAGDSSQVFVIGALLKDNSISPSDGTTKNVAIMSNSTAEKFLKLEGYQELKISLEKGADYDGVKSQLEDKIKNYRGIIFKNYKDELVNVKKKLLQISMIMYSFVLVVGIVSIVNLVNIMSMNIILRKREIGMLRSLGFGNDEVRKMIITEGLFYGINSSIWGAGLGTILSYLLFRVARRSLGASMTWSLPVSNILIMFAAAVSLCILASMNASRKVFSSSIVESIRGLE